MGRGGRAFPPERREAVRRRQAIVDAHPELRERELVKRAALTQALAAGLRRRGVPDLAATLAATIGDLALNLAYTTWLGDAGEVTFAQCVRRTLDDLRAAGSTLEVRASVTPRRPRRFRSCAPRRTTARRSSQ